MRWAGRGSDLRYRSGPPDACQNAENGFCVLEVKARGRRELFTLVGYAAAISAGEWVTATGNWVNDRTHGQQFKARFLKTSAPTSAEGIEKYLASGMIRGVGLVYCRAIRGPASDASSPRPKPRPGPRRKSAFRRLLP